MDIEPMSDLASPFGDSLELDYKGKTIRALMVNGVPWMSLKGLLNACRYNHHGATHVHRQSFPSFGKMLVGEALEAASPEGLDDNVYLSPTGVFYWSEGLGNASRVSTLVAWARREAHRLCPNPAPADPAFYLGLFSDPDGWVHMPSGSPSRYSGWRAEYEDLKWSDYPAWSAAESSNADYNRKVREQRKLAAGASAPPEKRHPIGLSVNRGPDISIAAN